MHGRKYSCTPGPRLISLTTVFKECPGSPRGAHASGHLATGLQCPWKRHVRWHTLGQPAVRMTSFGHWMLGCQAQRSQHHATQGIRPRQKPSPSMCVPDSSMCAGKPFEHDLLAFPFTPMVLVVWPSSRRQQIDILALRHIEGCHITQFVYEVQWEET